MTKHRPVRSGKSVPSGKKIKVYNIAVDARPLSRPMSGVARVISRVLKNFPNPERFRFFLYSHLPWHEDFDEIIDLPNIIWVQGRGLGARKGGLWFNLSLPGIIRKSDIDLFWGSQQVIPPRLPVTLPVVMTYYDLVLYFFPEAMRFAARIQQRAVQSYSVHRSHMILSISRQTQDDMIEKFEFLPERARVALLGYEAPAKKAAGSKEKKETQPLPLPFAIDKSPYILAVSTIEPRKNYGVLLAAYEAYLKREQEGQSGEKPYPLVIAGRRGWESAEFYERLEKIQASTGSIHILEALSDEALDSLYRNCAFFCMTSLYEGFGLPLLEALSAGKYCLASDIGCLREIGGEWIDYLPPKDVAAWSDAIVNTVELHRQGKIKKIPFPRQEWTWERTARIHQEAFLEVLTDRESVVG